MRLAIFGGGVIGTYLGLCLASDGNEVILIRRSDVVPLPSHATAYPSRHNPRTACVLPRVVDDSYPLHDVALCLVTTKARDAAHAARVLATSLRPETTVVALQNGRSSVATLRRALGTDRVAGGLVACNVVRSGDTYQRVTPGPVVLERLRAPHRARLESLARTLSRAGQPTRLVTDVEPQLAAKLLVNLNNGVCAALGLSIAESILNRDARWLYRQCVLEGLRVFRKLGIRAGRIGALHPRLLTLSLLAPSVMLQSLAPLGGQGWRTARSSTLLDLERGRPTEIDELNGAIVALARSAGIAAPANAWLTAAVHQLEASGPPSRLVFPTPRLARASVARAQVAGPSA